MSSRIQGTHGASAFLACQPTSGEVHRTVGGWIERACASACLSMCAVAQVTQRASVDSAGTQGDADSGTFGVAISADGRFVAFASAASNLVPGDTNGVSDVFVRDRITGTTERVSVSSTGVQGNGLSDNPAVSSDGRFIAFTSLATNLVPGDTNGYPDIFVRDRLNGTTERVNVDSAGAQAIFGSDFPAISSDGRYVAFWSYARNLVPSDTNGFGDVFVHDRLSGATERVSVDSSGAQGNGDSGFNGLSISGDGRYVAFTSDATNLVAGDTNGCSDVFVHDRQTAATVRVSVDSGGLQANAASYSACISADGSTVAFSSYATNLVAGDTNAQFDVFVHERLSGVTERASVDSNGAQANGGSDAPSISSDGRYVAFVSFATNLVAGDTNGCNDIFMRDREGGTTARVSVDTTGVQGNAASGYHVAVSADARFSAFESAASNLAPGDTNGHVDVFIHDSASSGFTSLCDPGVGGVIGCPCQNPPSGPTRGCDNSSGTGGASLAASGFAYLSADSLVFISAGEKPIATSVVLQGNALASMGLVFGQGVRCAGGGLERLYTKTASNGSITAPNIGAGDVSVSVRSAALGDVIQPGQARWYLVYYRDPLVLGGCPTASTFNATQTGQVAWSP
jgi:Tol biopolymer transport system component